MNIPHWESKAFYLVSNHNRHVQRLRWRVHYVFIAYSPTEGCCFTFDIKLNPQSVAIFSMIWSSIIENEWHRQKNSGHVFGIWKCECQNATPLYPKNKNNNKGHDNCASSWPHTVSVRTSVATVITEISSEILRDLHLNGIQSEQNK